MLRIGIIILFLLTPTIASSITIPQMSVSFDYSDQFGVVIDSRYTNLFDLTSALNLEIDSGTKEFRLATTWSKLFNCQHLLLITAEYLSQDILFVFDNVTLGLWDEQSSIGASYSYLTHHYGLSGFNVGLYYLQARDEHLHPRIYILPNYTIYRDVTGSCAQGGFIGLTFQPFLATRFTGSLYYDDIRYRDRFESSPKREGIGFAVQMEQIIHPRVLFTVEASDRQLYSQYSIQASWLAPIPWCSKLELSLRGQKTFSHELIYTEENRISFMISYRWGLPNCNPSYLAPHSAQEDVLIAATRPVVRMPQVFAARDQHIENNQIVSQ